MQLSQRISKFNRSRKWENFLNLFFLQNTTKILDVGFSDIEYSPVDNYLEKNYPYPEMITALGVDEPEEFSKRYPKVHAIQYPGSEFPFQDQEFDICWSNAVIEHVGNRDRQLLFLKEIKRVAKSGYITTPNRFFPVEPHTRTILLHLLPKKIFETYLRWIGKTWATGDYMYLLSEKELISLLKKANIAHYQLHKNKILGFTLDFVVTF